LPSKNVVPHLLQAATGKQTRQCVQLALVDFHATDKAQQCEKPAVPLNDVMVSNRFDQAWRFVAVSKGISRSNHWLEFLEGTPEDKFRRWWP
jgi:hypothetical protein